MISSADRDIPQVDVYKLSKEEAKAYWPNDNESGKENKCEWNHTNIGQE